MDTAERAGGTMGAVTAIVGAPGVQFAVTLGAILWLIFVGEPAKQARDHRWRYVGWAIAALFIVLVAGTFAAGLFEYKVQQVAATRRAPYQPWRINSVQIGEIEKFNAAHSAKFPIIIESLVGSSQSQAFGQSLTAELARRGWPVLWTTDALLRADLVGVSVSFPHGIHPAEHPHVAEVVELIKALGLLDMSDYAARSPWEAVRAPGGIISADTIWIDIGNEP